MSATRELEATAAQRHEDQLKALQDMAVKAAEVGGENKGTQRLLEFRGNELKRQRVEHENDMRRNGTNRPPKHAARSSVRAIWRRRRRPRWRPLSD